MDKIKSASFDNRSITPVTLELINGQVDLILRALELYGYNLEFMLNSSTSGEDEREKTISQLKYTYEQVLSSQAEQVNGKSKNIDKIQQFKGFSGLYSLKNDNKSTNVG